MQIIGRIPTLSATFVIAIFIRLTCFARPLNVLHTCFMIHSSTKCLGTTSEKPTLKQCYLYLASCSSPDPDTPVRHLLYGRLCTHSYLLNHG